MAKPLRMDWFLFAIAAGLAVFGSVMVYSASAMMSLNETQDQSDLTYFYKQFGFTMIGLIAMLVVSRIDYHRYQNAYFVYTAVAICVIGLIAVPLVLWITQGHYEHAAAQPAAAAGSLKQALAVAVKDPSFLLLTTGFFTCGFHVAFIATHLPGVVASCELPPSVSAWSLALIGLFNIFGSLWVGKFINGRRMKLALAGIYFARAMIILVFFFAPKTALTFLLFACGIGFTYLSTVPPTVGLVIKFYGLRYMATLFGVVMLSHQVGGFLGAYYGGQAFEATGSYDWMWWADIALCLMAAAVHLPIREKVPAPAPIARAAEA